MEMSNKLKGYLCLILALISTFTLGMYTISVLNNLREVEIHRWFLTGGFGLMFFIMGVEFLKKD